jgi:hypothetical protein
LYFGIGRSGHLRAAQAVEPAQRARSAATVQNIDAGATNAFRAVYGKAYLELVSKLPHVLGLFYDLPTGLLAAEVRPTAVSGRS